MELHGENNQHALDNKGADDLILFTFSSAVELNTLKLRQFGGDSDLSLWAGNGTISLNGMTTGILGTAILINNSSSSKNTDRTVNLGRSSAAAMTGWQWLPASVRAMITQNCAR